MSFEVCRSRLGRIYPTVQPIVAAVGRHDLPRTSVVARFADDTRGAVAMIFGLMSLVLFLAIGVAIDYSRFLNARNQTLAAADAAVLAGARALQTNGGDQNAAVALAQTYYNQAVKSRIGVATDTVAFSVADNGTSVVTSGNVSIKTPFMGLSGSKTLPLLHANGSDYAKALIAGSKANKNVEVSLMLDVSGSMGDGTKLSDMKSAANSLVDIMLWADQSKYTSRMAVVPFSGDVMPTPSLLAASTNPVYQATLNLGSYFGFFFFGTTYRATSCVAERPGVQKYTDALPVAAAFSLREYTSNGACVISSTGMVQPLTSDKTVLHSKINGLTAVGATAGHVGVAWTYYMLSPLWATILPTASAPGLYGLPSTRKIAILLTDGAFNSEHDSNGVAVGSANAGSSVNGTDSPTQAKAICTNMKNSGIEVYTIGFDLQGDQTAISTLSNCATDASHFYNSATGDDLKAAFNDIALKVSVIYLTQ